jgi:hypothetical protein
VQAGGSEIAQLNVARLTAPLDSLQLQPFVDRLDEINALAEASPGFRWRLQGEGGDATDVRIGNDPLVLVNMTVWATIDDLFTFTWWRVSLPVRRLVSARALPGDPAELRCRVASGVEFAVRARGGRPG